MSDNIRTSSQKYLDHAIKIKNESSSDQVRDYATELINEMEKVFQSQIDIEQFSENIQPLDLSNVLKNSEEAAVKLAKESAQAYTTMLMSELDKVVKRDISIEDFFKVATSPELKLSELHVDVDKDLSALDYIRSMFIKVYPD
jgi:hypothetical protein